MDLNQMVANMKRQTRDAVDHVLGEMDDALFDAIKLSRKELEKQLDVEGFSKNIMALPEKIRAQKEICKQTRTAFEEAKSYLVSAEAMLAAEIAAETNEAGKAKYSNDNTRRAELEIRKKHDFDYQQSWGPYKAALDEMDAEQFNLEQLQDELKAYQVVGGVLAARLSLMRLDI